VKQPASTGPRAGEFFNEADARKERLASRHLASQSQDMKSPWYISAAATREYLAIANLKDDDGGPNWDRATRELAEHAAVAREVSRDRDRAEYRTGRVKIGIRTKAERLEFTILLTPRPEGPMPQLVRVRIKGSNRQQTRRPRER
jgi:hypothetical protein